MEACAYTLKQRVIFVAAHACSFSPQRLAVAFRAIIMDGPSKEHRVPFLIGATNTGKSTIIESFDSLFGVENVFHLTAETDTKGGALRGWMQDGIRMLFWDEFEPVVFVAKRGRAEISVSESVQRPNLRDPNESAHSRWQHAVQVESGCAIHRQRTRTMGFESWRH